MARNANEVPMPIPAFAPELRPILRECWPAEVDPEAAADVSVDTAD